MRARLAALVLALAAVVLGGAASVGAQTRVRDDQPVYFRADRVDADRQRGRIRASGRVEVWQGDRVLIADDLVYDERTEIATATGNVAILEPSGDVIFADSAEITRDLKDGVADNLRIRLSDNARVAAVGGRRIGGTVTEMRKAVYSACEPCKDDPQRAPIWQVKADRVVQDSVDKTVQYSDAQVEFFGVPVLYIPYFEHPDPSVERKSGFLTPTFGNDTLLGAWVRLPYYYTLSPQRDVTVTPMVTSKENALLATQYRERFASGLLDMTGSFTYATGDGGTDEVRGHIEGIVRYDIDDTWRGGLNLSLASDDTFRRRYRFGSEQTLVNRGFVEGFRGRNYAVANAYYFQGLRREDEQGQIPFVFPHLAYSYSGQPDRFGGRWSADANMLLLTRTTGTDSRRLSARTDWQRPFASRNGEIITISAGVQSDAYFVDDVKRGDGTTYSGLTGRVFPHVGADWRLPLVRSGARASQLIEPVVGLIAAPNFGNPSRIPNEDSLDFDLDDLNLTSANPFRGHDRVAPGPRAYYGMRGGWYDGSGIATTAFLGQSYRFTETDDFPAASGFEDKLSDVVGRIDVSTGRYVNAFLRFRLDKEDLTPRRNEVALRLGPPSFNVTADYVFLDKAVADPEFTQEREEILLALGSQITPTWAVQGRTRRDLSNDRPISHGARLTYQDDCLIFALDWTRTFTSDRDLEPRNAVVARVVLKTLGSFGIGGSAS